MSPSPGPGQKVVSQCLADHARGEGDGTTYAIPFPYVPIPNTVGTKIRLKDTVIAIIRFITIIIGTIVIIGAVVVIIIVFIDSRPFRGNDRGRVVVLTWGRRLGARARLLIAALQDYCMMYDLSL